MKHSNFNLTLDFAIEYEPKNKYQIEISVFHSLH